MQTAQKIRIAVGSPPTIKYIMEETKVNKQQDQQNKQMNRIGDEAGEGQSVGNADKQLKDVVNLKKEQRKINEKDIEYLMQQFLLDRSKAVNMLRKYDLESAVAICINE